MSADINNAWKRSEKSGHDFTLIAQAMGTSTYWCEFCGSVMLVRNISELVLFHSPTSHLAAVGLCPEKDTVLLEGLNPKTLRDKISELMHADVKKLGEDIE